MFAKQFPIFSRGHLDSAFARYFYIPRITRRSGRVAAVENLGRTLTDRRGKTYRVHSDGSIRHAVAVA